ncbi:MAG: hypothetical protein GDA43_04215 [Hormoscilla sp. SP5CHS1]|nr:hypothetical protein [Hormoscilla sp. SP5CHS1]
MAIAQVSKIKEKLIASDFLGRPRTDTLYQEKLDPEKMIEHMVKLFDEFSTAEIKELGDEELRDRIDSILIIHAVSGTLNDLTPEELEIFDAAVENRWRSCYFNMMVCDRVGEVSASDEVFSQIWWERGSKCGGQASQR